MDENLSFTEPYYTLKSPCPPTQITIGKYFVQSSLLQNPTFCSYIYLCTDNENHQKKVIKFIKLYENAIKRITNEITIMRILNHPNIIKLENYFRYEAYYCLILPYTRHQSLLWFLTQYYRNGIPEDIAAIMMHQMLEAVDYLHGLNIIHRDIKPDNFLIFESSENNNITENNNNEENNNDLQNKNKLKLPRSFKNFPRVVLTDFGLSKMLIKGEKEVKQLGTPEYCAPEIHNGKPYDKSVDIWALGISLFLMITGYFPFPDSRTAKNEFKRKVKRGQLNYQFLSYWGRSDDVQDLIKKMCHFDPSKRITAKQALKHPWILSQIKTPIEEEVSNAILHEDEYQFVPGT